MQKMSSTWVCADTHVLNDLQNLGANPSALRWYQQAELVHARTAMTAVAGILIPGVSTSSTAAVTGGHRRSPLTSAAGI
jgi:hypothetical protein